MADIDPTLPPPPTAQNQQPPAPVVRRGRRSRLDDEVERKLTQALSAGNYVEASCVYAGISPATFAKWMTAGAEHPKSRYGQFRTSVERALASAEVRIVAQWQAHMPKNWVACAAFLERRFPERWARYRQSGGTGPNVNVTVQQAMGTLVATGSPQQGALASAEARAALVEMVSNMTPEQERDLLDEYERLEERAGALPMRAQGGACEAPVLDVQGESVAVER